MALFQERWLFAGAAPGLERIARALQERIGTEVTVHEARREADGRETPARIEAPGVCKGYDFELFVEEEAITVESATPPHPYLLPQLRAALEALGGTRARRGTGAPPADDRFLRPWAELGWKSRLILGRTSLWMFWKWDLQTGTPEAPVDAGSKANRVVHRLPVPDSGCGSICVGYRGLDVRAEYEYRISKVDWIGVLLFERASAFRFADEMHAVGFAAGSYDTVVEIEDSEWIAELRAKEPSRISGIQGKRHFAVLFSSNGYLEVVAESVSEGEPREGLLEGR